MIELNDCDCFEFCKLIDALVMDIQQLEVEIVSLRYDLSKYLPYPNNEHLRGDLLSNLSGRYDENRAYQLYMKLLHNGQDPMEGQDYVKTLLELMYNDQESNI